MNPDGRFADSLINLFVLSAAPVPFILHAVRPPLRFLQTRVTPPIVPHLAFLCIVFRRFCPVPPSCYRKIYHVFMYDRRCAGAPGTVKPLVCADCSARRCETRRWKTNRFFVYAVVVRNRITVGGVNKRLHGTDVRNMDH